MKRYPPTNDLLFKKMLATPGNENLAKHLVEDCFGPELKVKGLEVIDPYSIESVTRAVGEGQAAESALVQTLRDITYAVEFEEPSGRTITVTVEMQAIVNDRFIPRALYYLATAYTNRYGVTSLDPYTSLRPVWGLNILGQQLFPDEAALHIEQFPSSGFAPSADEWAWRLAFLELGKTSTNSALAGWIHLLETGTSRPEDPDYLQEAARVVEYGNLNPEERKMVDLVEKWRADQVTQETYHRRMLQQAQEQAEQAQKQAERAQKQAEQAQKQAEQAQKQAEENQEHLRQAARKLLDVGQDPVWVAEILGIDLAETP